MTDIVLKFIKTFKGAISFLIPDALFDFDFIVNGADYIKWLGEFLAQVNFFIPLHVVAQCLTVYVAIKFIKFWIFIQAWVLGKVADVIP